MADHTTTHARDLIRRAQRVLVLTGAGISAPSGVPTFRGEAGLWKEYRPEDLATPDAFARDPRLVWEWYGWRRSLIAACLPNAAHGALAAWMAQRPGVCLATQNVDGLHERAADEAGAPHPIRLHGSIFRVACTACGRESDHRSAVDASTMDSLPRCDDCGGLLRPAVVWFGETLPGEAVAGASEAARRATVCLVIGTSGMVYPAAGFAHEAVSTGATLVVVDPGATAFDSAADIQLIGSAEEVVPSILAGLAASG